MRSIRNGKKTESDESLVVYSIIKHHMGCCVDYCIIHEGMGFMSCDAGCMLIWMHDDLKSDDLPEAFIDFLRREGVLK